MIDIFHDIIRMFLMNPVHFNLVSFNLNIIHVSRYNLVANVSSSMLWRQGNWRTRGGGRLRYAECGSPSTSNEILMDKFHVTPLLPPPPQPPSLCFKMRLRVSYLFVVTQINPVSKELLSTLPCFESEGFWNSEMAISMAFLSVGVCAESVPWPIWALCSLHSAVTIKDTQ